LPQLERTHSRCLVKRREPEAVPLLNVTADYYTLVLPTGVLRYVGLNPWLSSTGTPITRSTKGFRNRPAGIGAISTAPRPPIATMTTRSISRCRQRQRVRKSPPTRAGFRLPVGIPELRELMPGGVLASSSIIKTIVARERVRARSNLTGSRTGRKSVLPGGAGSRHHGTKSRPVRTGQRRVRNSHPAHERMKKGRQSAAIL
jgi:hypothetical protein